MRSALAVISRSRLKPLPLLAPEKQNAAALRLAQIWLRSDRETARQWLTRTTLSEAQKQALLAERDAQP